MKRLLIFTFSVFLIANSFGQSSINITNIEDANAFLTAYISPLGESLGAGLNNGWYNTAKPHKLGGFDVTLAINTVLIPASKQTFDVNSLENFSSNSNSTPTILGSGDGATIIYSPFPSTPFTMPDQSSGIKALPIPTLNAGVGLFKNTELDFRYIPTFNYNAGFIGKGSINLWGVGVKHDILQWLPIVDKIPIDVAIHAGYTNLITAFEIESQGVGQEVELNINAKTFNLIVSKKFLMLTGYAGIGYNSSSTTFNGNTNFQLGVGNDVLNFDVPLEMEFATEDAIRANVGFRLQLAILAIQANYTLSEYPVATIGLGVSLR